MLRLKAIGTALAVILAMTAPAVAQSAAGFSAAQTRAGQLDATAIAALQNDLVWVDAFADLAKLPRLGTFDETTFEALELFQRRTKTRVDGIPSSKLIGDLKSLGDFARDARGFHDITVSGVTVGYPAGLATQREDRQSGPRFKSPKGDIVIDILRIPASQEHFENLYTRMKTPSSGRKISHNTIAYDRDGEPHSTFVIMGTSGELAFYIRFIDVDGESRGIAVSWNTRTRPDFYPVITAMAVSMRPAGEPIVGTATSKPEAPQAGASQTGISTAELNQNLDTCSKSKDADETIAACTAALAVGDTLLPANRPVVLFNRSVGYSKKGEKDLAIADLDQAIGLVPDRADYYTQRGNMYYDKKQYDTAIADYSKSIDLKPDNADVIGYRGNAYFDRGSYEQAFADYNAALRLKPDDANLHAYRGSTALRLARAAEALPDIEFILQKGGASVLPGDYINHGVALIELGRKDDADEDFQKAEALATSRIDADGHKDGYDFAYRAFARGYGNDPDGAIADATKFIALSPTDGSGFQARALGYAANGDYTRAIADFTQAINLGRMGFILRQRGDAYLAAGLPELAIADYQAMLKRAPGNVLAAAGMAKANQALAANVLASAGAAQGGQPPAQSAQTAAPPAAGATVALGRRVALVIGNGNYARFGALPNPKNDAAKMADTLRKIGFAEVTLVEDATNQDFNAALQNFATAADGADWAVIYYAGHGIEVSNTNYLIPVDAKLASDRDVTFETVPLDRVMAASEGAKGMRLVILDACRDNPFAAAMARKTATRSVSRGLSRVEPDGGTLVVYAAKAGQVAQDGDGGNSPFVTALTSNLQKPNVEIGKLFRLVRDDVMKATNRQQEPFTYGSLPGEDFIFNPGQ
jgi:tetratricopeptide (TPR) repeat protein